MPQTVGTRYGAIQLTTTSGTVLTTAYTQGTGSGPRGVFYAGTQLAPFTGYNFPFGVVKDASGNIYIADHSNNRVLKETFSGGAYTESTIGSGLSLPVGLAVDGAGNVYIGDQANNRVVKETLAGGIYTQSVVDGNLTNPNGVAVDGAGNVYVADTSNSRVVKETPTGSSYTQTTVGTGLSGPGGVAVDAAGNVYISDSGNNRVLKETLSAGIYTQTTVSTNVSNPFGISVDGSGNAYVSDYNNNRVLKEVLQAGAYVESTIATGLSGPGAVAVDQNGNVFIADSNNGRIVEVDVTDPPALTYASTSVGSSATPQTETLVNIGNADLAIIVPTTGNNPSVSANFTYSGSGSTACPLVTSTSFTSGILPAGASCDLSIGFTPTVVGSITGSLVLTDTHLNTGSPSYATQTINLSGTGVIAPTQLATGPLPSSIVAGGNLGMVRVTVEDAGGNTVTSSSASVTVVVTDPQGGTSTLTRSAVNGVASLDFTSVGLTIPGTYTVTTSSTGLTGMTSSFVVTVGAAAQLDFALVPGLSSPGNAGIVSVKVEDAYGNTVPTSTAPVTVLLTGPNGYSQTVSGTAVNGVAPVNFSSLPLTKAGPYYFTASSTGLSNGTTLLYVSAGAATQFVTSALPATLVSGDNLGRLNLTFEDAAGNKDGSFNGPFTLTLTGPNGYLQTVSGRASEGAGAISLRSFPLTVAGIYTATTSSPGLPSVVTTASVTAGPATQLPISAVPTTIVSGGNFGTLTATVKDASGNVVTTSSASVTTTITGPNGYSQTVTGSAVNGVASLNLSSLALTTSGAYTLTTSSPGLPSTTSTVTVTAAAAAKLVSSPVASTIVSGANLGTMTATIEDAYNNILTTSSSPVTTTITGPDGYSQAVTSSAVDGVASLNLISLPLNVAGTYNVTTSSPGVTGTSSMVTVTAGTASRIVLGTLPNGITSGGSLGTTTATVQDANGNTATTYTGSLTATLSGPNGYSQAVSGTVVNGVVTLNLGSLTPTVAGAYTLTASGSGLTPASTMITVALAAQTIPLPSLPNVTYGAGATTLPSTTSAGLPITYTVTGPATLNGSSLLVTGAGTVTVTATQAGDATHSPVTLTQSFTVAKAPTTTTLTSSSGVAITGTPVTLTAKVASTAGTPTVSVTFLNGSTVLGTAPVSSTGLATLTLSTLPTGALSLSAAYSGDANFLTSVSAYSVTAVQDFGIAATAGTPSVPVVPGAAANFTLALSPGAAGFSSVIALSATGMPAGATYSFSPATVTPGSATATTVLTVQTTKPVTVARRLEGAAGITLALLVLPFGALRKRREALKQTRLLSALGVLLLLGGATGLTGCGTSNGFFGQAPQSYTITVTGTSGALVHSTTVVLNVQ